MSDQPDEEPQQRGPLAGIRVLEVMALGPVALAGTMLADLGADVVLVARPGWLESQGNRLDGTRRGRRVIELDLKNDDGRLAFLEAAAGADVVLEGFRPGVLERLGLGPEELLARNPRLVLGRMTGWGQDGPRSQSAGHDINYLSLTGHLAAITGSDAQPAVPLNLVGDYGGGTMFLMTGVLSALLERSVSGRGQVVDAAMVDGASMLGQWVWAMRGVGRWTDQPRSNMLDGGRPWYDVYRTRDGRHMAVGALEPAFYPQLLTGLGLDGTVPERTAPDRDDPTTWPRLRELFTERFVQYDQAHWTDIFSGTDACVTPVLTYAEAERDEHLGSRGTLLEVDGVVQPAPAPRFSRTPAPAPDSPPTTPSPVDGLWARHRP
ncbi:CaiB/BaiF CoA transferase family protein [Citricoccus parietis]|uniref:peptidylprolyl isomerase n=2 Tax=Citricoccus parietis TaxID=592307 RepID=A0ABV6F3V9_9MICC